MEDNTLDQDAQDVILECGGQYVQNVLNALMENGFDTQATSTVFMGGGARLIKNFSSDLSRARFLNSIHANAKGYEMIARQVVSSNVKQSAV